MSAPLNYRLGFDVGERSVGFAAVEYDVQGYPLKFLAIGSYLHDGGMDPTTNKNPKSRKETRGVARRTMRMRRQKIKRLKKTDKVLRELGYQVSHYTDEPQTYEAWYSRRLLATQKISSEELNDHMVRAVRHMARHRGWRNPWWSLTQLESASAEPSETFVQMFEKAQERWADELILPVEETTLGMLGALSDDNKVLLRPRSYTVKGLKKSQKKEIQTPQKGLRLQGEEPILFAQVRQEDILRELRIICERQGISDQYEKLREALFEQIRPHVPQENVGRDPLNRSQYRALRASLEFQRFRILDALANLRVREGRYAKRPLSAEERTAAWEFLRDYRDQKNAPTWGDVAEAMGIEPALLVAPVIDEVRLNKAPYFSSLVVVEKKLKEKFKGKLKKKSEIYKWWVEASVESRGLLIRVLADATNATLDEASEAGLLDLIESLPEEEREVLDDLSFETGRAAYSADTLRKLADYMEEHLEQGIGVHEARKAVFGVDDNWQPPKATLEEATGQPTVDRVLTIVRRVALSAQRQWGDPAEIMVEYARTGLMGPAQLAEVKREIAKNRKERDRIRQDLKDDGVAEPKKRHIMAHRIVQDQNCQCMYCGTMISAKTCELDHIVPRAAGGSSRRENLAGVCRACNAAKGGRMFADWAADNPRGVTLKDTLHRLRKWEPFKEDDKRRLLKLIERRLKQSVESPEQIDERSLAPTAYAATAIRERLRRHFEDDAKPIPRKDVVKAYAGGLTRESRRAGLIDEKLLLRGSRDKSRLDVRHHAIDAAVLTMLNVSVARTLEERRLMKRERDMSVRDNGWRDYTGTAEDKPKFVQWKQAAGEMADLLIDAVDQDSIAVINPLRLRPQNGAVHDDTIYPVVERPIGEEWDKAMIKRVVDPSIYIAMVGAWGLEKNQPADDTRPLGLKDGKQLTAKDSVSLFAEFRRLGEGWKEATIEKITDKSISQALLHLLQESGGKSLPKDDKRVLSLEDGTCLEANSRILLYSDAAAIMTPRGGAKIGNSIHHARLYAWRNEDGKIEMGMQRVFGAEFPWLMSESGVKDVFKVPIHRGSQSYRDLQDGVREQIESGAAVEIGWITQGDEIIINPAEVQEHMTNSAFKSFIGTYQEKRWKVSGISEPSKIAIKPLYMSAEGWKDLYNQAEDEKLKKDILKIFGLRTEKSKKPGEEDKIISANPSLLSVSSLLALPGTKIIRRNHLGFPRWRGVGRPVSLDIQRAAREALEGKK